MRVPAILDRAGFEGLRKLAHAGRLNALRCSINLALAAPQLSDNPEALRVGKNRRAGKILSQCSLGTATARTSRTPRHTIGPNSWASAPSGFRPGRSAAA